MDNKPFNCGDIAICITHFYASVDYDEAVRVVRCRMYRGSDSSHKGRWVIDVAHRRRRPYNYSSYFADNFRESPVIWDVTAFHPHPRFYRLDSHDDTPLIKVKPDFNRADVGTAVASVKSAEQPFLVHLKPLHVAYRIPPAIGDHDPIKGMHKLINGKIKPLTRSDADYNRLVTWLQDRIAKHPDERWVVLSAHTTAQQSLPLFNLTAL